MTRTNWRPLIAAVGCGLLLLILIRSPLMVAQEQAATETVDQPPTETLTSTWTPTYTGTPVFTSTMPRSTEPTVPTATIVPTLANIETIIPTSTLMPSPASTAVPPPTSAPLSADALAAPVVLDPLAVFSSALTLNSTADAHVNAAYPTANTGTNLVLRVDAVPIVRTYLRFNLGTLPSPVSRAMLRLFANSSSSAGYTVHPVADNTWTETGITYNNRPPMGAAAGSSGGVSAGTWTSVDVTALVAGKSGALSLGVATSADLSLTFSSREGVNPPRLIIEVASTLPTSTPVPTLQPASTLAPTPLPAGTLTVRPIADSYVFETQPNANFGTNVALRTDMLPNQHSYLRFDLSGMSGIVSRATLRIFPNSSSTEGYTVHQVGNSAWNETTITYNNRPPMGGALATSDAISVGAWTSVDVTALVSMGTPLTLAIQGTSGTAVRYSSREGVNPPQLVIQIGSSPPPPTSTPTRTPTQVPTQTSTQTPMPSQVPLATPTLPSSPVPGNRTCVGTTPSGSSTFQPAAPYYATFFYPWSANPNTDSSWSYWDDRSQNPPNTWFSHYVPDPNPSAFDPANELYSSNNDSIIRWQLTTMRDARIEVAISSWWGQGHKTDRTFCHIIGDVMNRADNPYPNLRWGLYYEKEGFENPSVQQLVSDLNYIAVNYADLPGFLKINGKPVIFVYAGSDDTATSGYHQRWSDANRSASRPFYIVLKVFTGYRTVSPQPDSWHQYAPANRYDEQLPYSAGVSPGFWLDDGSAPRLPRDLAAFEASVRQLVAANAQWKLIITWNEWGEGTSVEPGQQVSYNASTGREQPDPNGAPFGYAYIDVLRRLLPPLG